MKRATIAKAVLLTGVLAVLAFGPPIVAPAGADESGGNVGCDSSVDCDVSMVSIPSIPKAAG